MTYLAKTAAMIAGVALAGSAAMAQTTTPAAPAPSTTAGTTTATTSTSFTDGDIDNFASAAIAVQKIQQDASVPDADKQTKMASAVTSSGLTADRFNAIAKASQSDPALMKRIQIAAASKMQAAPAASSSTPSAGGAQ